jgi:Leucine-rich repeat (LRR) protein
LGSRFGAAQSQENVMQTKLKGCFAVAACVSVAWAMAETAWIEHAGGTVAHDAGGQPIGVDLRASWTTDSDMPLLAQMKELKRLDLSLTRISDRGLRALKGAPTIEELDLSFAEQITDEGAATVKGWKHLRRLNLRGTKITDATLEFLSGVPSLEWLDIGWGQVTDTGLGHLAALTNLRHLAMGGNKLTDTSLQFLRQMPQIEYLDLGGMQRTDSGLWSLQLSDEGMRSVEAVTELRELRLAGTAVTGRGLGLIASLPKLERLNLQGCRKLRDDAAAALEGFKQLRVLDLKDSSLPAEAVTRIRAALPACQIVY